jgi:malonate transporter and related proteins
MQNFLIVLSLVVPVFLIVALGYILKKFGMINENFVKLSSRIVFSVTLPALIFSEISAIDISQDVNMWVVVFIYAGTLLSFILSWLAAILFIKEPTNQTVFIQGSFRGNFAIVGLALIANVYGQSILGKASLVLAFTIPLYNVLSVIALTVPLHREKKVSYSTTFIEILKNPLILAVIAALPFSIFRIPIHHTIGITIDYLAAVSLPLALLGIGGFMDFADLKQGSVTAAYSTLIKLVLIPSGAVYAAYLFDFRGSEMGIIFILFACPTAIASFIMAEAMGSNSRLAANILLMTTLVSVITITVGLFILKENGLI